MVRQEQDRLPVRRHLKAAGDDAFRREFAPVATTQRRPREPHAGPVAAWRHRPDCLLKRADGGRHEELVTRAERHPKYRLPVDVRREHDLLPRAAGRVLRRPVGVLLRPASGVRRSDRKMHARGEPGRPKAGQDVRRPTTEYRLDVDPAPHAQVAPDTCGDAADREHAAGRYRLRQVHDDGAAVDRRLHPTAGQRDDGGRFHGQLRTRHGDLQRRRTSRVPDQPVGEPQARHIHRAGQRYAEMGVPRSAEILDRRQQPWPAYDDHDATRNRSRSPGASSAGGSRDSSHSTTSVRPRSCQPPGEAAG